MKKMRLPPGSPTKRIIASPRKRLTVKEIKQSNKYAIIANHRNLPDSSKTILLQIRKTEHLSKVAFYYFYNNKFNNINKAKC